MKNLVVTCWLLYLVPCLAFESRNLGDIDMKMRSRSPSEKNQLLLETLTVTVNFLDKKFKEEYASSSSIMFDKVSLSAISYEVDEVDDGQIASVSFNGRAFFMDGTSPAQDDVIKLTTRIFQEQNQAFLRSLMQSKDPFLTDISYAIVRVNGDVVAEQKGNSGLRGGDKSVIGINSWILMAAAGGVGFIIVVATCLLWYCCSTVTDEFEEDRKAGKTPSKVTRQTIEEDSYMQRSRSPSPVRSITSQDSSLFTYNPKSCKSFDSKTFGSFLTSNTGVEMDVEAWQKGTKVQKDAIPFGHDISAIENKKDLSLIEEGSEGEEPTPDSKPRRLNLNERALADLDRNERRLSRKGSRSSSSSSSSRRRSSSSSRKNAPALDLDADAADVINDLKDLSQQIDRYRTR